jgi:peptide/nickel transport system substrate-binding protein
VGIDKQRLVDKLLYGLATVGTAELNLGWAKMDIPPSEYNPEKAMALLDDAGWTDSDDDGVRECNGCSTAEDGRVLKLKLQTTSGNALREQAEQVIIEMMADIGIDMYIENVPSAELFGSYSNGAFRKHGQFDILMYTTTYGIDPQSHIEGYYGSNQIPCDDNSGRGTNYSRWIDDEADRWIQIAGTSPDIDARAEAYQKVGERIAEGRPQIYLYDRMEINAHVEDMMGWEGNIWETIAWNSEAWYLKK